MAGELRGMTTRTPRAAWERKDYHFSLTHGPIWTRAGYAQVSTTIPRLSPFVFSRMDNNNEEDVAGQALLDTAEELVDGDLDEALFHALDDAAIVLRALIVVSGALANHPERVGHAFAAKLSPLFPSTARVVAEFETMASRLQALINTGCAAQYAKCTTDEERDQFFREAKTAFAAKRTPDTTEQ